MSLASREKVTAVVVTNGRDFSYARTTLDAVGRQTHLPTATVLVTTAPLARDLADTEPHETLPNFSFVSAQGAPNFSAAVNAGLEDVGREGWIWLLHADSAPEPQALDHLLRSGEHSPATAIVGPKQVAWDGQHLLEVGIRATRSARRVPEVIDDERDQGQLDSRSDVLGVGTAGMLVRASVWHELGGLSLDLGPFGDGLEFSRRARLAGHRVVVVPSAVVRHARLSLPRSFAPRRRAQILNALIAAPAWLMPLMWVGYILGAPVRALLRLAMKEPPFAFAELRAGGLILGSLGAVLRGRAQLPSASHAALRQLEDSPSDVRAYRREAKRSVEEAQMLAQRPSSLELKARADLKDRTFKYGVLAALLGLAMIAVLHLRNLTSGALVGGSLLGDSHTAGQLWQILVAGWSPVGDGAAGGLDPFWALLIPLVWLGSIVGASAGGVATFLHVLAPLAASLAAFRGAGTITTSPPMRLIAALMWVAAPPFLESQTYGFVGPSLIHVLLPLAVSALVRAWHGELNQVFALALVGALLSAITPAFVLAFVVASFAGLVARSGQRLRWLWVALPAASVVALALEAAPVRSLALWLSTPGAPALSGGDRVSTARGLLDFFATASPGANPLTWVLYVGPVAMVVLAVFAVLRGLAWKAVRFGWLAVALGLSLAALAVAVRGVWVPTSASLTSAGTLPQVGLSVTWLGLTLAVLGGSYKLRTRSRSRAFGLAHTSVAAMALTLVAASLVTISAWGIRHPLGDILDGAASRLPAIASPMQSGEYKNRVLALIATDDGVRAELWRRDGLEMSEQTRVGARASDAANKELSQAVADLAAGSQEAAGVLARHAVGIVLVPQSDFALRNRLLANLGSNPGLEFASATDAGIFWRVGSASSRLMLDDHPLPSGTVSAKARVDATGGVLRLAERNDPHFIATVDGEPLARLDDPWANAWTVPGRGTVEIMYDNEMHRMLVALQIALVMVSVVGALPLWRRRGVIE
ncbi:GT2 family glycosyltransferase [Arcanobacterium wilhelmae]|uniref:GT2 family glycosyltransferase n=1 Tax=Arcanobacterium wilhelmae TaxID=1803177 RepID=A0ABT9NCE5_9ACTO|nr:glycosyltransferase [Arcanobacterium wilhelmae]MDP9801347.1 GT2 family glycosyltransferase [Arcanobacterium wilhelmae]WFN90684.1 glycosyltransferase [Arcanobacterium wilhelmae]